MLLLPFLPSLPLKDLIGFVKSFMPRRIEENNQTDE